MLDDLGVEDFSLEELDKLFSEDGTQETPPADDTTVQGASPTEGTEGTENKDEGTSTDNKEETKAFAKRLSKKIADERLAIAKAMGFNSYEEMIKSRENKLIEDKGLDPEQVTPVVEELVKQRLDNDPRMKELEALRRKQVEEFGKKELAEITKLTGGEITKLSQLPREVIDLWKQKGSLKSAYLEVEGEKLITRIRGEHSKGSTGHLGNLGGVGSVPENKRPLTAEEKQLWKLFVPGITDEELNKKTIDK